MIAECLNALFEQKFRDFDLYVCDNASTDDSVNVIRKIFSEYKKSSNTADESGSKKDIDSETSDGSESKENINSENHIIYTKLIINQANLGGSGGFDAAMRVALEHGGYDYIMCVDNDALLDENAVGELVAFMDAHPDTGMAASKIYNLEQPDVVQNFGQRINYETFSTEPLYYGRIEDGSMPEVVYSDAVPACSLLVRKEVIDQVGLMPEENYLYWDDTEWCARARAAGYRVASVGSSAALHSMGARKEDVSTFPTYYAWRNWICFFIMHTPEEKLTDMCISFLTEIYLVQAAGYSGNRFRKAAAVMAAYDDAIHGVTGKARDGIIGPVEKDGEEVVYESVSDLPQELQKGYEMFVYASLPEFLRHARIMRTSYVSKNTPDMV